MPLMALETPSIFLKNRKRKKNSLPFLGILHTYMYICEKVIAMQTEFKELIDGYSPDQELKNLVTRKVLLAKDLPVSYRQINHWNEKGILMEKTQPGKWREFSFMEYVWLLMVVKLREWGIGLQEIKRIRDFMASSIFHFLSSVLEEDYQRFKDQDKKLNKEFWKIWDLYSKEPEQFALTFAGPEYYHLSFFLEQILEPNTDILLKINPNYSTPVYWVKVGDKEFDLQRFMDSFFSDGGGVLISLKAIAFQIYHQTLFDWKKVLPPDLPVTSKRILQVLEDPTVKQIKVVKKNEEVSHMKVKEKVRVVKVNDLKFSMLKPNEWEGSYIDREVNDVVIIKHRKEKF